MADLIGQRISNYEITSILGKGGMAVVYQARQLNIQREVAIKVIKPDLAETDDLIRRFEREANTVAALSHPHILKLFDFGQYEGMLYLVMELMSGGTLAGAIRRQPLLPERAAQLLDQIASALDYAHSQGLIHRDLKPQNILLDKQNNAHLTDFGIAKVLTEQTVVTQTGVAIGTPAYMAPEQWQGQPLDARADVYALGVTLYEMLTGKLPFKADTPASYMYRHLQESPPSIRVVNPDLPRSLDRVIQKAMAKTPAERFASAGEMASAFRRAIEDNPVDSAADTEVANTITELPPTLPAQTRHAKTRSPLTLVIAGVLTVLIVGGFLIIRLLSGATTATPTITQLAAVVPSATASASSTLTSTPIPPTATAIPTLDTTLAAQSTNAAIATINAVRTQLFVEGETGTATQWTATSTASATFTPSVPPSITLTPSQTYTSTWTATPIRTATLTPSPTVPTLTPTITYTASPSPTVPSPTPSLTFTPSKTTTPTLVPTPSIAVWDDFSSPASLASKWQIQAEQITAYKIVDGALKLQTSEWMVVSLRIGKPIRAIGVLVTLPGPEVFGLQVTGSSSYSLGVSCIYADLTKRPASNPANGRFNGSFLLPRRGCRPSTHLLYISLDGVQAHFLVDGKEYATRAMAGDATSAFFAPAPGGPVFVNKVWVEFAP